MGWDAFGLPAEQHAIADRHPPARSPRGATSPPSRAQLKRLGFSLRLGARARRPRDPDYYRWTQWIFLQALRARPRLPGRGAGELVPGARHRARERGGDRRQVRRARRPRRAPPDAAVDAAHHRVRRAAARGPRRRSTGPSRSRRCSATGSAAPRAPRSTSRVDGRPTSARRSFTTRPDTLFGATFCVLAPEHPLVGAITTAAQRAAVEAYVRARARRRATCERTDRRQGARPASSPARTRSTRSTASAIPIWIADYVLASYGTGAIMARARRTTSATATFARDVRPADRRTVQPRRRTSRGRRLHRRRAAVELAASSTASTSPTAKARDDRVARGAAARARRASTYKLRDWLFSRQRYWGEPFPLAARSTDGTVKPLPDAELPVAAAASSTTSSRPRDGQPPLARADDVGRDDATRRPAQPARRETNTMPQWAGSCWYYLRFLRPAERRRAPGRSARPRRYWMPVDLYVGGAEHAVLHLLYARFWHKVLFDLGLVSTKEPFQKLFNQGMILAFVVPGRRAASTTTRTTSRSATASRFVKATGDAAQDAGREDVEVALQRRQPRRHRRASTAPTRCGSTRCSWARSSRRSRGRPTGVDGRLPLPRSASWRLVVDERDRRR